MNIRPLVGFALVLATAIATGCTRQPAQSPAPAARVVQRAPTTAPAPAYPVIVRLVGRDKEVTICSGPDGPVFSAVTKAGDVLVTHATLEELRENHPSLYRFVHPALVTDASVGRPQSVPMITAESWSGR